MTLAPARERLLCLRLNSVRLSPSKLPGCTRLLHLFSLGRFCSCASWCCVPRVVGPFSTHAAPLLWGRGYTTRPTASSVPPTFLSPHPFHSSRCFSNSSDAAGGSSIQGGVWFFCPKECRSSAHLLGGGARSISRSYVFRLIFCNIFREKRLYYFFIQPAAAIFGVYHANHSASVLLTGSIMWGKGRGG